MRIAPARRSYASARSALLSAGFWCMSAEDQGQARNLPSRRQRHAGQAGQDSVPASHEHVGATSERAPRVGRHAVPALRETPEPDRAAGPDTSQQRARPPRAVTRDSTPPCAPADCFVVPFGAMARWRGRDRAGVVYELNSLARVEVAKTHHPRRPTFRSRRPGTLPPCVVSCPQPPLCFNVVPAAAWPAQSGV
jgi:hypothetical protein